VIAITAAAPRRESHIRAPQVGAQGFAGSIAMSEDTKFGLIVLFMVFAIAVIGPALAG